jgi:hypothetical protein
VAKKFFRIALKAIDILFLIAAAFGGTWIIFLLSIPTLRGTYIAFLHAIENLIARWKTDPIVLTIITIAILWILLRWKTIRKYKF